MVSVSPREELKSRLPSHFPQARVMATIGVTRGLGDHNLKVCSSTLPIKPFLSCFPEVSTPSLPEAQAGILPRALFVSGLPVWQSSHLTHFLSPLPAPQVRVYDLTQYEHCPDDVLVLGTDGLWDVTDDCEVAATVDRVLSAYEPNDPSR